MKPHVSIYISDVAKSKAFYTELFQCPPSKEKDDYLKWDAAFFPWVISMVLNPAKVQPGFGHLGFRVNSLSEVLGFQKVMEENGHKVLEERDVACCYANQDKFWIADPDGYQWEVYVLNEDSEFNDPRAQNSTACCTPQENTACCTPQSNEKQKVSIQSFGNEGGCC
jgi:catechol 2,3-dioxygenase-like lactoylglutathione lyase family enzyme